ncbi:hypothetical protein [Zoogloea sp.]|uniref:hypothetical protein n=1 Tax=Zoogloea sp. TaxID=49181 RepID=UPI0025DDCF8F|nr:hypothetical protein [Zoogloea sp.]MCK6393402.1 hypothetical protein [Zoogloea sp.]
MTGQPGPLVTGLLAGSAVLAYDALAHYVSSDPDAATWVALLTALPAAALLINLLYRRLGLTAALLGGLASVGGALLLWPLVRDNLTHLYLLQYLGTNLALASYFGHSLTGGRTPACTTFAMVLHPSPSPTVIRYTRQVTVAWTVFFLASAGTSMLLYLFASTALWSAFTNLFYLPSLALMFIVEGLVRRKRLPPEERHGIIASVKAYMTASRTPPPPLTDPDLPPRIS